MVQINSETSLSIDAPQGRKLFVFDRVFGPEVDQAGVWEYLEDCVNAFTQGYNVSLLAYGQSGAGKSYTMGTSGPVEQDDLDIMGESFQPTVLANIHRACRPGRDHQLLTLDFRCHSSCWNCALRSARRPQGEPQPGFHVAASGARPLFCAGS